MLRPSFTLAACLLCGCARQDNPSVRNYEQWLQKRFNSPRYSVGTPRADEEVVFETDFRSQPDKGLSRVRLKSTPGAASYVYGNQTRSLIQPVFADRLAAVSIPAGRWTYIDTSGQFLVPALFRYANPFVDGVATAQLAELGTWVLLSKSGSIIELDPSIAAIQPFSAGYAAFSTLDRRTGYIDRSGNVVIPAAYEAARPFCRDGTAVVRKQKKWGIINAKGGFLAEPQYDDVRCFAEDLAAAKKGSWGFIDRKGAYTIEPRFASVEDFSDGLAAFKTAAGAYGVIDRNGSVVVQPNYSWLYPFQFGIAKAGTRKTNWMIYPLSFVVPADPHYTKWSYINRRGVVVAEGQE